MASDLNENMTSEEIKSFAEAIVQEVEQERKEEKSDAQIASEHSTNTPADSQGSDTVTADSQDEETGDSDNAPDWVTDDLKAEVAAYGIEESDLLDFASREELDRALRLLDKTALQAGREAQSDSDSKTRNEKGQFVKDETSESEEETPKNRYEVALDKDLYDEDIIGEFNRMRDYYESRLETLETRYNEVNAVAQEQEFDQYVDLLGHADLFGKTGSETPKELERRRELHEALEAQLIGLRQMGKPAAKNEKMVARVANMVFADELSKKRLKQQTSKISRQSNLRQGGSPTKPSPMRDDPRVEADRLYKELSRS
jgi:hypothetical protein